MELRCVGKWIIIMCEKQDTPNRIHWQTTAGRTLVHIHYPEDVPPINEQPSQAFLALFVTHSERTNERHRCVIIILFIIISVNFPSTEQAKNNKMTDILPRYVNRHLQLQDPSPTPFRYHGRFA